MEYLVSAIIGYMLGSIPTAYLLLKKVKGIDITKEGSQNVGAMNSYEVTDSKLLGLVVFIIDAAKGALSVWVANLLFGDAFLICITALFFAVLGHCFSVWLKFKGGRGLATAFGGSLLFTYSVPVLWIVFWIAAYVFRKNVHFGNVAATILTGVIALVNSDTLNKYKYNKVPATEDGVFGISVAAVMFLIVLKHLDFMKMWFFSQKRNARGDNK